MEMPTMKVDIGADPELMARLAELTEEVKALRERLGVNSPAVTAQPALRLAAPEQPPPAYPCCGQCTVSEQTLALLQAMLDRSNQQLLRSLSLGRGSL